MKRNLLVLILCILLPASVSCLSMDIPSNLSLLPPGSFVIRGQMMPPGEFNTDCKVFLTDTGVQYHLFQHPDVSNEDYDTLTTPGTISRLEVQVRTDLVIGCRQVGDTVEVLEVLELIPVE